MDIQTAKNTVKLELESLIEQCHKELRNLERYSDNRMLIATADLRYHFEQVIDSSENLGDVYDESTRPEVCADCDETREECTCEVFSTYQR